MMQRQRFYLLVGLALLSGSIYAASQREAAGNDWCDNEHWGNDREGVCEVRQYTVMAGAGPLAVDATPNGGIQVLGGPRADVLVEARVVATAATEARAREIASGVRVDAAPDRVAADGPRDLGRREGWHVSYRLSVPTQISLTLETTKSSPLMSIRRSLPSSEVRS